MRLAIGRYLEVQGFETGLFDSAEALLAGGAASAAQCLVLDIHLPGMSGIALARHLVSLGVNLPVIFITGRDSEQQRRQLVGEACYLVKPFPPEALVAAVNRALRE